MKNNLLTSLKRIQSLAETGLHYAESDYDKDRYSELEKISLQMIEAITNQEISEIKIAITEKNGYRTPKVDVRAVVFNEAKEILMVKEKADGFWSLPGGWADIGFSPSEIAVKETFEEAGLNVKAEKVWAVFDKKCHNHPPDLYYAYKIFISCIPLNGNLNPGYETSDVAYFAKEALPQLSTPRNTLEQIEMMFSYNEKKLTWPHID